MIILYPSIELTITAELYRAMGRHADAKRCYAEAVRHRPQHAPAWSGLAAVAKEEGDPTLALACYQEGESASQRG